MDAGTYGTNELDAATIAAIEADLEAAAAADPELWGNPAVAWSDPDKISIGGQELVAFAIVAGVLVVIAGDKIWS